MPLESRMEGELYNLAHESRKPFVAKCLNEDNECNEYDFKGTPFVVAFVVYVIVVVVYVYLFRSEEVYNVTSYSNNRG